MYFENKFKFIIYLIFRKILSKCKIVFNQAIKIISNTCN